jgi:hypothetical protein
VLRVVKALRAKKFAELVEQAYSRSTRKVLLQPIIGRKRVRQPPEAKIEEDWIDTPSGAIIVNRN